MISGADVVSFLLADSAISALVGTRVYPLQVPQNPTYPLIRYTLISDLHQHSGTGVKSHVRQRWQVDAVAASYSAAWALAEAIRSRMDAYKGTFGSSTAQGVMAVSTSDFHDAEAKAFLISRDFYVWSQAS